MEDFKRNCNTCKNSIFQDCKVLMANEEFNKLNNSNKSNKDILNLGISDFKTLEFKDNFICDKYNSIYIEYPIEVSKINNDNNITSYANERIGKLAKIRPTAEEYNNKTYLGVYLGELPNQNHISYCKETKELNIGLTTNPAIFVFELNKIIYGYESWWSIIENEETLKNITDEDINNVWYIKLLNNFYNKETNKNE